MSTTMHRVLRLLAWGAAIWISAPAEPIGTNERARVKPGRSPG